MMQYASAQAIKGFQDAGQMYRLGNFQPLNGIPSTVQYDDSKAMPAIERRPPNWNGYTEYNVTTRRGLKQAAKFDWAKKVQEHWKLIGYIGGNTNKTKSAFQHGWLVNTNITPIQEIASVYAEDFNKALALAYKRYNYHPIKFQKKQWINNPIGLTPLMTVNTMDTMLNRRDQNQMGDEQDQISGIVGQLLQNIKQARGDAADLSKLTGDGNGAFGNLIMQLTGLVFKHSQIAEPVSGQPFEFKITEDMKQMAINRANYVPFIGAINMSQAYPKNHSFLAKLGFLTARGYKLQGMKYGLAVQNQIFDTMYAIVIPRLETEEKTKPIIAIPKGQRYTFSAAECDLDDTVVIVGNLNRAAYLTMVQGDFPVNYALSCHAELCYSTLLELVNPQQDLHKLNEQERIRKPKLDSYMLQKGKVIIGSVRAQNGSVVITSGGTYEVKDIAHIEGSPEGVFKIPAITSKTDMGYIRTLESQDSTSSMKIAAMVGMINSYGNEIRTGTLMDPQGQRLMIINKYLKDTSTNVQDLSNVAWPVFREKGLSWDNFEAVVKKVYRVDAVPKPVVSGTLGLFNNRGPV